MIRLASFVVIEVDGRVVGRHSVACYPSVHVLGLPVGVNKIEIEVAQPATLS